MNLRLTVLAALLAALSFSANAFPFDDEDDGDVTEIIAIGLDTL